MPFAYTLTVWGAGALCVARFGRPSAGQALLFVTGASLGFLALAAGAPDLRRPAGDEPLRLQGNVAALPAVGAVYLLDRVVAAAHWNLFLSALVATLVYFPVVALAAGRRATSVGPSSVGPRRRPVG